jgi:hypothetical protein
VDSPFTADCSTCGSGRSRCRAACARPARRRSQAGRARPTRRNAAGAVRRRIRATRTPLALGEHGPDRRRGAEGKATGAGHRVARVRADEGGADAGTAGCVGPHHSPGDPQLRQSAANPLRPLGPAPGHVSRAARGPGRRLELDARLGSAPREALAPARPSDIVAWDVGVLAPVAAGRRTRAEGGEVQGVAGEEGQDPKPAAAHVAGRDSQEIPIATPVGGGAVVSLARERVAVGGPAAHRDARAQGGKIAGEALADFARAERPARRERIGTGIAGLELDHA